MVVCPLINRLRFIRDAYKQVSVPNPLHDQPGLSSTDSTLSELTRFAVLDIPTAVDADYIGSGGANR